MSVTRGKAIGFLLIAVVACSVMAAPAQTNTLAGAPGRIKGLILDQLGSCVPDARITLEGANFRRVMRSNENGEYVFEAPAGLYRISIQQAGFRPLRRKRVSLSGGVTLTRDFTLFVLEPAGLLPVGASEKND